MAKSTMTTSPQRKTGASYGERCEIISLLGIFENLDVDSLNFKRCIENCFKKIIVNFGTELRTSKSKPITDQLKRGMLYLALSDITFRYNIQKRTMILRVNRLKTLFKEITNLHRDDVICVCCFLLVYDYHPSSVVAGGSKRCFRFSTINPKVIATPLSADMIDVGLSDPITHHPYQCLPDSSAFCSASLPARHTVRATSKQFSSYLLRILRTAGFLLNYETEPHEYIDRNSMRKPIPPRGFEPELISYR
ncbi:hypothetical protein ANN_15192 [Periplaneta americana]|uniref:Uncharacterized protein n=1 Tax=Periplaneta americana TaxID=6978 RepID=A0ABQ8SGL9_PERAM|nr:hypothetical protein ANN_15192 [Periplaneta americana]